MGHCSDTLSKIELVQVGVRISTRAFDMSLGLAALPPEGFASEHPSRPKEDHPRIPGFPAVRKVSVARTSTAQSVLVI
jgi:hypothetical protein